MKALFRRGKDRRPRRRRGLLRRTAELGVTGAALGTAGAGLVSLATKGRIGSTAFLRKGAVRGAVIGAALPSVYKVEKYLADRYPEEYDLATKAGILYGAYQAVSNRPGARKNR